MTTETATKERPILFSGPMVRAILDGSKTQTRRVVHADIEIPEDDPAYSLYRCPYGKPGDRLWVREAWATRYEADRNQTWIKYPAGPGGVIVSPKVHGRVHTKAGHPFEDKKHSSIHMPRWASRITLEITDVRVQRVQEISEDDAKAEGVDITPQTREDIDAMRLGSPERELAEIFGVGSGPTARFAFQMLWDSINGKKPGHAWADNPWVWVVTFKRIEAR